MKLDYVDIFYSHRHDLETPLEETLQALVDIVRRGKALYVGLSRYPLEAARFAFRYLAERDVPCLLFQDRYNIFSRQPETSGVLSLSAASGSGFVAFSPLAQGLLTGRYLDGIPQDSRMAAGRSLQREVLTDAMLERLRALNDIARQRGQTLEQGPQAGGAGTRLQIATFQSQLRGADRRQPAGVGKRLLLRRRAGAH